LVYRTLLNLRKSKSLKLLLNLLHYISKERETGRISYSIPLSSENLDSMGNATLTDINGKPLSGKEVVFEIGDQSVRIITDPNGIAAIPLQLLNNAGNYDGVLVSFSGDEDFLPSADSKSFEILK
jgi:hypothetical protein